MNRGGDLEMDIDMKYEIEKLMTKIMMAIVWKLPRKICYLAAIRVIASATQGTSSISAPELLAMDALKLWEGK